jgi:hypothetical protein
MEPRTGPETALLESMDRIENFERDFKNLKQRVMVLLSALDAPRD